MSEVKPGKDINHNSTMINIIWNQKTNKKFNEIDQ